MVTSTFFNKFDYKNEQMLLDSLVTESIKIHGQDMLYIPIRRGSLDGLYYEDDTSFYDTFYTIETYVKSYDGFQGQQTFMSTIGLEIRDQVVLSIARSRFEVEVTRKEPEQIRPFEGDLIYFPLNKKLFKILFVDDKPFFYQFGELQMFDLSCELFEYSNEILNTGIEAVDRLQTEFSINVFDHEIRTEDNDHFVTEDKNSVIILEQFRNHDDDDPVRDNARINDEEKETGIQQWDEDNPFTFGDENEGFKW